MTGIYFLLLNNKVVYIGQTKNLKQRISSHKGKKKFDSFRVFPCNVEKLLMYERRWIVKFQPEYNIRKKNKSNKRKSPLTIRIPKALKDHIKAVASPNVNAWIVEKLKKASKYKRVKS